MADTPEIAKRIEELEREMARPDFWADKERAQAAIRELNELKSEKEGGGKYDSGDAIVTIFSGAGGDDAEDFSRILLEMYQKYAARKKLEFALVHENLNDHGGYRNVTFQLSGRGAYGQLKKESGVHRLVRISPFSAKKLRHTSFSLVEVLPNFEKTKEFAIPPEELEVEFARSSGPGGQNVNKRETAVRVVHKPTGLTAHSESERSQQRNRDKAVAILSAKLYKKMEEERMKREQGMYVSKTTEIEWGNQIRSYVFHPYKLIKDHRSGYEETDIDKVLEGDLDDFIEAEKQLEP
jgi:peptide chain release factor 2